MMQSSALFGHLWLLWPYSPLSGHQALPSMAIGHLWRQAAANAFQNACQFLHMDLMTIDLTQYQNLFKKKPIRFNSFALDSKQESSSLERSQFSTALFKLGKKAGFWLLWVASSTTSEYISNFHRFCLTKSFAWQYFFYCMQQESTILPLSELPLDVASHNHWVPILLFLCSTKHYHLPAYLFNGIISHKEKTRATGKQRGSTPKNLYNPSS